MQKQIVQVLPRNDDSNTFESQITGRKYIRSNKAKNLVYLTSDKKCGLHYVGETENTLHVRMNKHKNKKNREKPVAAQFCQLDHIMKDLQVRGIKKIHRSSTQWRREREHLDFDPQNAVSTWAESG